MGGNCFIITVTNAPSPPRELLQICDCSEPAVVLMNRVCSEFIRCDVGSVGVRVLRQRAAPSSASFAAKTIFRQRPQWIHYAAD
jgi:hypothetical protein